MIPISRHLAGGLALAAVASVAIAGEPQLAGQRALIDPDPPARRWQDNNLAMLGRKLFEDTRLSGTGRTACASCHGASYAFADPRRVTVADNGKAGARNAPSLIDARFQPLLMLDGRFASLEAQATSPFDRGEMGISVETAVWRLNWDQQYVHLFRLALGQRPTAEGMAKAIAAYERTLVSTESPFDRFLRGNAGALSPLERDGFVVFDTKGRCSSCHFRPNLTADGTSRAPLLLTDFRFHNLGVGFEGGRFADLGRYQITGTAGDLGAFRTPSLRNVARTAPYMHDGSLATLEDVIAFYDRGGRANPNLSPLIRPLRLDGYEKEALVAFLRSLTDRDLEERGSVEHPDTELLDRIGISGE